MKNFFKEFGAFISKGNAFDLAIGIIIGGAFNKIIGSLVKDIIMPLISLIGGKDFTQWFLVLRGSTSYVDGVLILSEDAILWTYGNFIQTVIDFIIIAFAIFLAVKVMTKVRAKAELAKQAIVTKKTIDSK